MAETRDEASDARALLEDWLTIWQSELAGLVVDREAQAAAVRMAAQWAASVRAGAQALLPPRVAHEPAARPAGADASARAAPIAAASGPDQRDERDRVIEQLLRRVAELERRLGGAPG